MPTDEARQSPQSFVRLSSPWKHSGDVRVERDHNAALGVTGRVLVRPRSAEVVLRKNLVNSNLAGSRLSSFIFPHILSAHGRSFPDRKSTSLNSSHNSISYA